MKCSKCKWWKTPEYWESTKNYLERKDNKNVCCLMTYYETTKQVELIGFIPDNIDSAVFTDGDFGCLEFEKGEKMKKIFLICSVRDAEEELQKQLLDYVNELEKMGNVVHYPRRDTNQNQKGIDICRENAKAIKDSDEVHIWYVPTSQGSHFDMGVAFSSNKPIVIVQNVPLLPDGQKCYQRMLTEWEEEVFPDV